MKSMPAPAVMAALPYALLCALIVPAAHAEVLWATNGSNLITFDSANPGTVVTAPLTGLQTGETLVGLDLRPGANVLYGVGSTSRLYTISALGIATPVGTAGQFTLSGTRFGVDFDPVAEPTGSLRVVSDTQQNLRLDPSTGLATIDTALAQANITAVAYDDNVVGTPSSDLYAIDPVSGLLNLITSPNAGGPVVPIAPLGLGMNLNPGIAYEVSGLTGTHYATISMGASYNLYRIDPTTGAATLLGSIGTGNYPLRGLAAAVPEPVGAPTLAALAGVVGLRRSRRTR